MANKNRPQRYIGRIVSAPRNEEFAFIGKNTITNADGTESDLVTDADVFLHRDECAITLIVGIAVEFEVIPDAKRGEGHFRARGATEFVESEIVPEDDPLVARMNALTITPESGTASAPLDIVREHRWRGLMKHVPEETVEQVAANEPLDGLPRAGDGVPADAQVVTAALRGYLEHEFPHMAGCGMTFDIDGNDTAGEEAAIREVLDGHHTLGMDEQAQFMEQEFQRFTSTRSTLAWLRDRGLVRPQTIVPNRLAVDICIAVPTWYVKLSTQEENLARTSENFGANPDPRTHPFTRFICELIPNDRWAHTFQMFNRRTRPLATYRGETIPTNVVRTITEGAKYFDYVAIAAPHLDRVGEDWENIDWIRTLDPYVLGFKRGLKHFFIIDRFSGDGVYPLYHEMVADTIEFLRLKKDKLEGFNRVGNPYWFTNSGHVCVHNLGSVLIPHTEQLLAAFEAGHLFDWLRGEWDLPKETDAPQPR